MVFKDFTLRVILHEIGNQADYKLLEVIGVFRINYRVVKVPDSLDDDKLVFILMLLK